VRRERSGRHRFGRVAPIWTVMVNNRESNLESNLESTPKHLR
jgi:hypothetical protein